MSDNLFDMPETKPRWQQIAEQHGIVHSFETNDGKHPFARAVIFGPNGDDDQVAAYEIADTEKNAVIGLVHRLRLEGWQELSPR